MKKGNDRYLWSARGKTFTPCAAGTTIFQRENLNLLIVCFTQCTLFFSIRLISIANLFAVRYLWDVCNEDNCRDTSRGRHSSRVAWLVYLACLHSHVLRAYCKLESKQAISFTLLGRRPNNKVRNLTSNGISNIQELPMLRCLHFPLTLFADRIESVK